MKNSSITAAIIVSAIVTFLAMLAMGWLMSQTPSSMSIKAGFVIGILTGTGIIMAFERDRDKAKS